jgi:hypothetical protein
MAKNYKNIGWRVGSAIIVLVFIIVAGTVISLFWMGGTEKIEATANQFKPSKDWVLVNSQVVAPKSFCGDVECPSVSKQWKTDHLLSKDEFSALLKQSKWDFPISGECLPRANASGSGVVLCSAEGVVDSYYISISISSSDYSLKEGELGLSVKKNK